MQKYGCGTFAAQLENTHEEDYCFGFSTQHNLFLLWTEPEYAAPQYAGWSNAFRKILR